MIVVGDRLEYDDPGSGPEPQLLAPLVGHRDHVIVTGGCCGRRRRRRRRRVVQVGDVTGQPQHRLHDDGREIGALDDALLAQIR